jgi:uncharacterized membrane protein YhhN
MGNIIGDLCSLNSNVLVFLTNLVAFFFSHTFFDPLGLREALGADVERDVKILSVLILRANKILVEFLKHFVASMLENKV